MSIRKVVSNIVETHFGDCSQWKVGDIVNHPELGRVKLVSGSFYGGYGRVSNFWNYRRVDRRDVEFGKVHKGYGWRVVAMPNAKVKTATKEKAKPVKAVKASEVSSLEAFSNVIHEMGERKREEDEIAAKLAKKMLPEKIAELKTFDIEHLFDLYDAALNGGYSNHKMMTVLVKWKQAIKDEIISRIAVENRISIAKRKKNA